VPQETDQVRPKYLTTGGREQYDAEINRCRHLLDAELDQRAAAALDRHETPELTRQHVEAAARTVFGRRPGPSVSDDRQARTSLLAAILLTISSVGVGVMPNFLDEPWQVGLFALLIVVGVVGLLLTWVGGTKAKRGSPASGRADAARLDG
jgi:hypothetical protein